MPISSSLDATRLSLILDAIPVPVFVKDKTSRFVAMNKACEDHWGIAFQSIEMTDGRAFFPENQMIGFLEKDREIFRVGKSIDFEERVWNHKLQQNRVSRTFKYPLYDSAANPALLVCVLVDITAEKDAMESLRHSEEKLRSLYEMAPLGIALTTMSGKYIEFNEAFSHICGYSQEELRALDYWKLTPPEYAGQEAEQLKSMAATGRYGPYEKEYVHKSGTRIPLRLNGMLVTGADDAPYIWSIVEDISERKKAEEEIQRLLERVEFATEAGKVGIWEYRIEPDELIWDARMFDLYGIEKTDVAQKLDRWKESIHPTDRAAVETHYEETVRTRTFFDTEFRIRRPDGETRHIRAKAAIVCDESGKPSRMVGTNWDVTELRILALQLEREKDIANKANQAKSDLLATMSHELRTPLNAIVGFSDLMLSNAVAPLGSPKYMEYTRHIHSSGELLSGLIEGLLDLARVESGNVSMASDWFDVNALVEECIQIFRISWVEQLPEIRMEMNVTDVRLNADRRSVTRVLLNLLSNAAKNTPHDGTISVCLQSGVGGLSIVVADTGVGISPENLSKLGARFVRIENDRAQKKEGTGLGLFICQSLVERHGGSLSIASEIGCGTTVTVQLPPERITYVPSSELVS